MEKFNLLWIYIKNDLLIVQIIKKYKRLETFIKPDISGEFLPLSMKISKFK